MEAGQPTISDPVRGQFAITQLGEAFVQIPQGSTDERVFISKSLMASDALHRIAGSFMTEEINQDQLAQRLTSTSGIAIGIARRSARTLLVWKRSGLEQATSVVPSITGATEASTEPPISVSALAYVRAQFEQARLVALLGANMARGTLTTKGVPLPIRQQLVAVVWDLCFPGQKPDPTSDLDELVQLAAQRNPKRLASYFKEVFSIDQQSVSPELTLLLDAPWARVYTLAVDNLEVAAGLKATLRRKIATITPADPNASTSHSLELSVIHLHGSVFDGTAKFSVGPERGLNPSEAMLHERFATDYMAFPLVAFATDEDVDDVWRYLERRGRRTGRGERELRPKSILVAPTLSPVRIALLRDLNVEFVRSDPHAFITQYLTPLRAEFTAGHSLLAVSASFTTDAPSNVEAVSDALSRERKRRTEYLLGQEPVWDDIRSGRAIRREIDRSIIEDLTKRLTDRKSNVEDLTKRLTKRRSQKRAAKNALLATISGTARSGKSTSMMRLAMELSAAGYQTGWIGRDTELSSRSIRAFGRGPALFQVVMIDEADRYGSRTAENLSLLTEIPGVELIVGSLHSSRLSYLLDSSLANVEQVGFVMPPLADSDISLLLDTLTADHRLGILKGTTRAYQESMFKKEAGRSLLVAMIQATSGRRFEEKVFEEWKNLEPGARYYYTLITIASMMSHSLTKDEILRAGKVSKGIEDLASLDQLVTGNIISKLERDRYRSRHALLAETLHKDLVERDPELGMCYRDLAFSATSTFGPDTRDNAHGRFIKRLINYRLLKRVLDLEGARSVYEIIQDNLHWDYHFWLQRGSLEVADGDIRYAEQYLNYAKGINSNDDLVITEYAYMLMKRAVSEARSAGSEEGLKQGVQLLRGQIATRGDRDYYPYHVLGSQALAWVARCGWSRDDRVKFLKAIQQDLKEGVARHPKHLEKLARDIQERVLAISAGLDR